MEQIAQLSTVGACLDMILIVVVESGIDQAFVCKLIFRHDNLGGCMIL